MQCINILQPQKSKHVIVCQQNTSQKHLATILLHLKISKIPMSEDVPWLYIRNIWAFEK